MARHEADREDLMREATAFRQRGEFAVPGEPEPVFAGFRDDGRLSIYFGSDPMYQFESNGALRRAFVDGALYRSQGETLAKLIRRRTETETVLLRQDLSFDELFTFLAQMRQRCERLWTSLRSGAAQTVRRIPEDQDIVPPLTTALKTVLLSLHALARAIKK
jgi:hypothetical protein